MGPSKKCSFWSNGPSIKAPQILLGRQKDNPFGAILSNLAILRNAALFEALN